MCSRCIEFKSVPVDISFYKHYEIYVIRILSITAVTLKSHSLRNNQPISEPTNKLYINTCVAVKQHSSVSVFGIF